MCEGRLIADVVAAIGSIDIVLGRSIDDVSLRLVEKLFLLQMMERFKGEL